jgi:hypothetical protein
MAYKKEVIFVTIFLIFLINISLGLCTLCDTDKDGNQICQPSGPELEQKIANKENFDGNLFQAVVVNGVTINPGKVTVSNGLVTADKVLMNGLEVEVKDAKIEGGKIVSGSFKTANGDWQNVEDASISTTETNIGFATYATITPSTASGTTTLVNAKGVKSTRTTLKVAHADSISVGDTTFTNVNNFTTDFVTFSLDSADVVIAETMVFNNKPFL